VNHPARDDMVQFGSSRPRRPWPRWVRVVAAAAALAAAATVIAVAVVGSAAGHARKPSAQAVTEVGHRLLGIRAGWELLGRGPGVGVRIEFARGRVTRTAVPVLQSTGPVSFVAGAGQAVIRPLDDVPGYLVRDGHPARGLPGGLDRGFVFAGPQPGQLWVQAGSGRHSSMFLVGPDGGRTGLSIPVPAGYPWALSSDGSGYLLFGDGRGVYDARPGVLRRITTGAVAAEGPTGWLAVQCQGQGQHHCSEEVIDPASGARRVISGSRTEAEELDNAYAPPGVISPDGSTAAVYQAGAPGQAATLHLIDLSSGADHPLAVSVADGSLGLADAAWSPDSRWLFVAGARGKLLVIDARTRRVSELGVTLPKIYQVAVDSGPR
jgi:hypothetical protein